MPENIDLFQIPVGQPITLLIAIGELIEMLFPGAQLAPGEDPSVSAIVRVPTGTNTHAVTERLREAAAIFSNTEFTPMPKPEVDDIGVGPVRADPDGSLKIGVDGHGWDQEGFTKLIIGAFKPTLDKSPNYVELGLQEMEYPFGVYTLIVVKPDGKSPHALRKEAEDANEDLKDLIRRMLKERADEHSEIEYNDLVKEAEHLLNETKE